MYTQSGAPCTFSKRSSPLPNEVRRIMRLRHLTYYTEKTYIHWILRFIRFHKLRHPRTMSAAEITQFLSHLAVHGQVAASTQNQALNALVFLYREVLKTDPGTFEGIIRARRPKFIPVVICEQDVSCLLGELCGSANSSCAPCARATASRAPRTADARANADHRSGMARSGCAYATRRGGTTRPIGPSCSSSSKTARASNNTIEQRCSLSATAHPSD